MKLILGLILILVGIAAGLYIGLWWAFIGGIVVIVEQVRATNLDAMTLALGIARVVFASAIGWLSAMLCIAPGLALVKAS